MNLRNDKVLVVGGGTCAVLLLVACAFLIRANTAYQKQTRMLERQYRRLAELNARNPFPSLENVRQSAENLERLGYQVGELAAQLARDPFPPDAVDAADFSARAQGVIERLGARAGQAGIVLPASLEVGFSQYASGGAIPEPLHVPRLSRQLYSIEKVADVLVRSGVYSIDALTRDAFETQGDAAEPADTPRRRPRRDEPAAPKPQGNLREVASAVQPDGLYYVERVGATFTAKEENVWQVLDLLAAAPHFMVVAEFAYTTQGDILDYNPEAAKRGGEGDAETLKFLAGGILTGKKALSRPERIIAGHEMIHVTVAVDVYNFEPERERESAQ
jgi:hypothetical protein